MYLIRSRSVNHPVDPITLVSHLDPGLSAAEIREFQGGSLILGMLSAMLTSASGPRNINKTKQNIMKHPEITGSHLDSKNIKIHSFKLYDSSQKDER